MTQQELLTEYAKVQAEMANLGIKRTWWTLRPDEHTYNARLTEIEVLLERVHE